ncbi:MAG: class I tRNA ligase family protein, partial [Clostridia bacterium]|nr:class I tRNA ligase family protein [Clostridia bacterium]
ADAVRWYFYTGSAPWLPTRFFDEAVSESQRKFMGTLWNTYAFYIMYAEIDSFNPNEHKMDIGSLHPMDKWILSRLNTLTSNVTAGLDEYKIFETGKELQDFVDDLSNWYVRRSRERFWAKGMELDKMNAYLTLYTCLETCARLVAPFTPFMAEAMYQNIVRSVDKDAPISVHLCDYPKADANMIDKALEDEMAKVLNIVVLGRAARNNVAIKNRQPLSKMMVSGVDGLNELYTAIIKEELNVKNVEITSDAGEYMNYLIKPQLKTLGPKYGKILPKIKAYLESANGRDIVNTFKNGETISFSIDGTEVTLCEEDTLIEPTYAEGYAVEQENGIAVVLETALTDELINEGYVREIISKVQTMRKEAGFEVTDRITLTYSCDELKSVVENNEAELKTALLADNIVIGDGSGYKKELDINGHSFVASVEKIK